MNGSDAKIIVQANTKLLRLFEVHTGGWKRGQTADETTIIVDEWDGSFLCSSIGAVSFKRIYEIGAHRINEFYLQTI